MVDLLVKSKYPIIVLEGPDGAGKTSLAKELQKHVGARYVHLTYRWKDKMDLYHLAAIRYCARLAQHQPVILDRWWVSEIMYAEAYRGGSSFIKTHFLLEHIATKLGVTYVACLPQNRDRYIRHYEVLKNTRVEMYDSGMSKVFDLYTDFYMKYMAVKENVIRYDMFEHYRDNVISREVVMSHICQYVLEFTEDHRSTL